MSEGWCSQRGVGVIGSERGGVVRGASGHRLEGTPGPAAARGWWQCVGGGGMGRRNRCDEGNERIRVGIAGAMGENKRIRAGITGAMGDTG
jgi:hypothetical protein